MDRTMLKIGNIKIDTYPVSKCNLKQLCKTIYPIPAETQFCPVCGARLKKDYCYAIQISESECIKTYGAVCYDCDAFFSKSRNILQFIEKHPYAKQPFTIRHDFDLPFDETQYSKRLKNGSAFLQYVMYVPGKMVCYTLVYDTAEEDETHGIFHYASKTGLAVLRAEKMSSNSVELEDGVYTVLQVKRRAGLFDKIKAEVYSVAETKKVFSDELPDFTSERTLYVYNGNTGCHKRHHVYSCCAHIESFDKEIGFYVEYCSECDKYLMKHDDYSAYLKRYKFFPMKINRPRNYLDDFGRAETSELFDNGYSVNQEVGLSEKQRHAILAFMIDYGIMEQRKILNHIEMLIKTNGQAEKNEIALTKWENDKQFVLNYRLTDKPFVKIGRIERR